MWKNTSKEKTHVFKVVESSLTLSFSSFDYNVPEINKILHMFAPKALQIEASAAKGRIPRLQHHVLQLNVLVVVHIYRAVFIFLSRLAERAVLYTEAYEHFC